jgi:hypothetical protein
MHGEPEGGGGGGGRGRRAVGAAVGRRQLHPRQRLHHAAPRLPAGAVAQEAPPPPPRRLPARARLQGPLQRHRRGTHARGLSESHPLTGKLIRNKGSSTAAGRCPVGFCKLVVG